MKNIAIIVPALDHNVYHQDGDLAPFGDISLLEWKLAQLKHVVDPVQVYVSSPSEKVLTIAQRQNVQVIRRDPGLSLAEMITFSLAQVQEETILWTNATAPFMGSHDYEECIAAFRAKEGSFDSLVSVYQLREYLFYDNKPLNFSPGEHISRRSIEPAYQITNGCFIIGREAAVSRHSYIGSNPLLRIVDKLTATEIKDITDLNIANDLLALYMQKKEL